MKYLFWLSALCGIVPSLYAAGTGTSSAPACTVKATRKAWHKLTTEEKAEYIRAEKCLMSLPAKLGFKRARTRYDELHVSHSDQAEVTHGVGAFLPWHRIFMHAHEYLLKTECDFKGTQPYWDEPHDARNFTGSAVLDPVTGFGGTSGPDRCIQDGPFVNYTAMAGPAYNNTDHCIDRRVSNNISIIASQQCVDECYQNKNFSTAWPCIEGLPHNGGHAGIGGILGDPLSAPGDPIFYLHHSYLDKVWWNWQKQDLPARLTDMTGANSLPFSFNISFPGGPLATIPPFTVPDGVTCPNFFNFTGPPGGFNFTGPPPPGFTPPPGGFPPFPFPPAADPKPQPGDPGNTTTLTHVLNMYGIIPNATIADIMDIGGGYLCYEYE